MKTFIVDSFTDAPFKGNPAGVCFTEASLSDETMLHVARELNLSETAFIRRLGTDGTFSIRYFSPKMEIPLCGHATLASAKVIFATSELREVSFVNVQDFHSRYFWPWSGTNEDPVTGGTHTFLATYWSIRLGKRKMTSFQSSKRTGFMEVELAGGTLLTRGEAVIVLEGRWVAQG